MSVSTTAHPQRTRGTRRLSLAILLLIAAGVALAWFGAGSLRGQATASGLQFRTVTAGSGAPIKVADGVLIEYEGRLPDGTVFDTSEGRGPAPMIVGQVIPGFAEALTMRQKGGRTESGSGRLGYGAEPPQAASYGQLDLESTSTWSVVPTAGLMQGARGPSRAPALLGWRVGLEDLG